ncbi:hypothetical protein ACFPT7_21105 [Acidicapsa dinghuensis]|uniref:Uncharacterized protein n=1 Tax=Acidicapsa dinghuensis TaxID=2218256 RepID=A0ABW1END2_9BACT|nr:hypothetical protein [Acidicapsa dinghuensis]
MNNNIKSALALGLVVTAAVLATSSAEAEIHSKSKELVVMEARDLPEQAQTPGNSLFLHSDNGGDFYLYVEQQQGARLSVFDVTDPARIKLVVSMPLAGPGTTALGAFDFVRPVGYSAELVYFRDSQKEGMLDLHKAKKPVLRMISAETDFDMSEPLGESGFLVTTQAHRYTPAVARNYQVMDVAGSIPTQLATVKDVKHRVTNDYTGTTFLLGSDGLTVVRRLSVENDYKERQYQTEGN